MGRLNGGGSDTSACRHGQSKNVECGLFVVGPLLEWFRFDPHAAAPLALLLSIVPAFYSARPIAARLYPNLLRSADQNAAKRLWRKVT